MSNKTACRAGIRLRGIGVEFSYVRRQQGMQPFDTGHSVHIDDDAGIPAEQERIQVRNRCEQKAADAITLAGCRLDDHLD
jgi:hypothetical protein